MRILGKREKAFDFALTLFMILIAAIMLVPFMQVITVSISDPAANATYGVHIFPKKGHLSFDGYSLMMSHKMFWRSYLNSIGRTILGLAVSMALYITGAYALSKRSLPHYRFWNFFFILTMYFKGGLIPTYLLVQRLGLGNTVWALILPSAATGFTIIILRNFFMNIPASLEESARMEGANSFRVLFQIVVPLSMPVLATVSLWEIVRNWNDWFHCMIYIRDSNKYMLQYVLRLILIDGRTEDLLEDVPQVINTDAMKMASLVIATIPIMCIYPFLQKYFVKGVMVGSVKE